MEAELIAVSQAGRELLGLKELFGELDMMVVEPMPMWVEIRQQSSSCKKRNVPKARKMLTFVLQFC